MRDLRSSAAPGDPFIPLVVRARLASGVAHAAPWGLSLDGLLAGQLWAGLKAERLGSSTDSVRAMDQADPPDLDLPLARCIPDDGPWHWAATCAFPEHPQPGPEVRLWTGRLDHRALEQVSTTLPKTVSSRQGRYRSRRMPLLVTVCPSITWYATGDPHAVHGLLVDVVGIGKKRASGEGHVLAWEVTPAPDLDPFTAAHLHPDGSLGRPTPPACLAPHGERRIVDGGIGRAGIRPPYVHRSRQHDLHLPAAAT